MAYKITPILLIIALVSVAVFGVFGMGMGDMAVGGAMHDCLFTLPGSEVCASLTNALAVAAHYLDMFRALSTALSSFDILALVFSLVALFAFFLLPRLLRTRNVLAETIFLSRVFPLSIFAPHASLLRWLSFHYKRDPYALARVHLMNVRFKILNLNSS
ncbi:MAG: hypothetical protein A3D67_01190 [Candidatus Lloydbacteria bacterium RIFCSPHIGHO2_02_FULL_51_22]|uniref:Uncharacterized protein n=2 Tax=Candidatus Lloydiibacteriota TaxID=1817910 RepID=A0A1G2DCY8_9BACT|nr:MAG: hypothetical protein A3D67_01190 [Candidatus Lloydbacteria bacterium RIFCSPHIGHO2_02_FULL_51_22]OGZ15700.1 MAG: hypothetical protein A3J08_01470 [Candidatus Lloydbacteria bacterium RIFCSPLOWO2_02_FULL_51_11]